MTKTRSARSTGRHRAPSKRETTRPTIFDLYEQVRDIVSPLELELRYAELDEFVPSWSTSFGPSSGLSLALTDIRMPTGTLLNIRSATPSTNVDWGARRVRLQGLTVG